MKAKLIKDFNENSYILTPKKQPNYNGLLYEVQFTGYEEIGINYRLERREFESFMLTYVISGYFNMLYDGKYYKCDTNTLTFIDCRKPHETWPNPDGYKIIYIHIYNPNLADFCKYVHDISSPVISLCGDCIGFKETILSIHQDIKGGTFNQEECSEKIYSLLLKLNCLIQNNSYPKPSVPDYINKLVKFINERYFEKLTLTVCSEHVNVSPTHLENSFKKYTGQPIAKYISAIRFKHAQRLLVTTSHPISKIAEEVGLEESQVLIRLFKKHLGITPLTYRKLRQ